MALDIALCLFRYFPHGGAQRSCRQVALEAKARGHQPVLFVAELRDAHPSELGFPVVQLPVARGSNHQRMARFADQLLPQLGAFAAVVGFNKLPGLDVYYAADPCLAWRLGRSFGPLLRGLPRYRRYLALERAVFQPQGTSQIWALTPRAIAEYRAIYGRGGRQFHLLPPGLTPDRLPPEDLDRQRRHWRSRWGVTDHTVILCLGSSFYTKGLDRSLKAVASLSRAQRCRTQLWVVGHDSPRQLQRHRRLAKGLGIASQVLFLGVRDDVPHLLRCADLLLHPARREVAGAALLEAVINGLPVLASGCCGYGFHVKHANAGWVLTEPFSQESLNAALAACMASPDQRFTWNQNGLAYGRGQVWGQRAARAVDLLEELVRGGRWGGARRGGGL